MEVRELQEKILQWKRERKGELPTAIAISPETFNKLASDKDAPKHIELYESEGRIIGHKFDGIPLPITDKVSDIRMISQEDGNISL